MNQEIGFACDQDFGRTTIVECGEFPFASSKGNHLELINEWNEKVRLRETYII